MSANDLAIVPPIPWFRHRWPWLLMMGPAWVLAAGSVAAYLAFSRPDAMVVDDYYSQGKAINQDLRRERVAHARAIAVELRLDPAGRRLLAAVTADGRPLAGVVHVLLVHPTQPAKDVKLDLLAAADGSAVAPVGVLEATRWGVQVEGAARDWRLAGSWVTPAGSQGLLLRAQ